MNYATLNNLKRVLTRVKNIFDTKVDKVTGKGLSTNDYTTAEKNKLAGLSNYDDTAIRSSLDTKVDKVTGKGLSTNDYTNADKTKVTAINSGSTLNNDISGNAATATSADYPTGFTEIDTDTDWGVQTGRVVTSWGTSDNCDVIFRENCPESGKLSQVIDGYFYQNEGQYRCIDESDIDNLHVRLTDEAIVARNIINTSVYDDSGSVASTLWVKAMEWEYTGTDSGNSNMFDNNMVLFVQSNRYNKGSAIVKIRAEGNASTGVVNSTSSYMTMILSSSPNTTYLNKDYIKLTYKTANNVTTFKLWQKLTSWDSYTFTILSFNDRLGNSLIDDLTLYKARDANSSDYMTERGVTADGHLDCGLAYIKNTVANADNANSADNVSGAADDVNAARHVWFSDETTETQRVYDDDFKYNPSTNTLTVSKITGSAARLNTSSAGSSIKPVYFLAGIPQASTGEVGSGTEPIFMTGGELTKSSSNAGTSSNPVYLKNGKLTACGDLTASKLGSTDIGSTVKPIYLAGGTPTPSSSNVGDNNKFIYMQNGELKPCTLTITDGAPVTITNGEFVAASGGGGGGAELIYQFNGSTTSFIGGGGVSRNSAKPITIQNLSNYSLIVLNGTYYAYNDGLSFKRMFSTTIPLEELKLYKSDSSNQGFALQKAGTSLPSNIIFWYENTNILKIGYYASDYTKEGIITAKIYAIY